jgi:hypothetical protein
MSMEGGGQWRVKRPNGVDKGHKIGRRGLGHTLWTQASSSPSSPSSSSPSSCFPSSCSSSLSSPLPPPPPRTTSQLSEPPEAPFYAHVIHSSDPVVFPP